jgi:hypothetical protein
LLCARPTIDRISPRSFDFAECRVEGVPGLSLAPVKYDLDP